MATTAPTVSPSGPSRSLRLRGQAREAPVPLLASRTPAALSRSRLVETRSTGMAGMGYTPVDSEAGAGAAGPSRHRRRCSAVAPSASQVEMSQTTTIAESPFNHSSPSAVTVIHPHAMQSSSSVASTSAITLPTDPPVTSLAGPNGIPRSSRKGKERASPLPTEKRILPSRIRRAAGGGADGVRDLEEMVVDWLNRFGEPCLTPPDDLQLYITSLPLSRIDPPAFEISDAQLPPPIITLTPTHPSPRVPPFSLTEAPPTAPHEERIITPSWKKVKAGEDDREEAREELEAGRATPGATKRLRKGSISHQALEDTSDAYYNNLHRKYEAFERRQRKTELDKLQYERFKMRSRIDLLRNMSPPGWAAVVSVILSRGNLTSSDVDIWAKGREKVKMAGVEWLRRLLVREGEELMKRYDQLLPSDQRKNRLAGSPASTPAIDSVSPPPPGIPARVAELKTNGVVRKRTSRELLPLPPSKRDSPHSSEAVEATVSTPQKGIRQSERGADSHEGADRPKQRAAGSSSPVVDVNLVSASPGDGASSGLSDVATSDGDPPEYDDLPDADEPVPTARDSPELPYISILERTAMAHEEPEAAITATTSTTPKPAGRVQPRVSRRIQSVTVQPFGVSLPGIFSIRADFNLLDADEDFWSLLMAREAELAQALESSLESESHIHTPASGTGLALPEKVDRMDVYNEQELESISADEALELERVEASVIL